MSSGWRKKQIMMTQPKEPEQEPVGEAYLCDECQTPFDGAYECPSCGHNTSTKEPVYTTPYVATPRPQRTWVGLDNDDLVWIYSNSDKVGQAISNTEARLKEKNGYA